MVDTYEICKEINKKYGHPAVPKGYTGQLKVGCKVFQDFGDKIFHKNGVWYFLGDKDTYKLKYVGDSNPYWPAYQYNRFSISLIQQGLIPEDYFNG